MSSLVTNLLMHLPNLYLCLASFTYVRRLVLFMVHHLKGVYNSIFRIFFLLALCYYYFILMLYIYIYIYIYICVCVCVGGGGGGGGTCIHGWQKAMSHPTYNE